MPAKKPDPALSAAFYASIKTAPSIESLLSPLPQSTKAFNNGSTGPKPAPARLTQLAAEAEIAMEASEPFWDVLTSGSYQELSRPADGLMWVDAATTDSKQRLLDQAIGFDDVVREKLWAYLKTDPASAEAVRQLAATYPRDNKLFPELGIEFSALLDTTGKAHAVIVSNGSRMLHCAPCNSTLPAVELQHAIDDVVRASAMDADMFQVKHAIRVNEVAQGRIKTDLEARDAAENEQPRSAWYQAQLARYKKAGVKEWVSPSTADDVREILNSSLVLSQHSDSFDIHEDGAVTRALSSFWGNSYLTNTPLTFHVLKYSNDVKAIVLCEDNKVIRCFGLGDEHREFDGYDARTQYECPSGKVLPEINSFITENGLELAIQCSKNGLDMTPYATGFFRDSHGIIHNLFDMKDGETIHGNMWISGFPAPVKFGNNTRITGHANLGGCKHGIHLGNYFTVMKDANFGFSKIIYGRGLNVVGDLRAQDTLTPMTDADCLIGGDFYISRMSYVTSRGATLLPSKATIVGRIFVDSSDYNTQIKYVPCSSTFEANASMLRHMRTHNNIAHDSAGKAHHLLGLESGGIFEGVMTIEQDGGPAVIPHGYSIRGGLYAKGCVKPIMFGNKVNVTGVTDLSYAKSITWGEGGQFETLNVCGAGLIEDKTLSAKTLIVNSDDPQIPERIKAERIVVQRCGYDGQVNNCSKTFRSVREANAEMMARQGNEAIEENLLTRSSVRGPKHHNRLALH